MKKILFHLVDYIVVAGLFFVLGGSFRDYDVKKRAGDEAARSIKFYRVPVPQFASVTVDSTPWTMKEHLGKVVALEFWATWCPPCVEAIPFFKRLHDRFKDRADFELVGISLDGNAATVG